MKHNKLSQVLLIGGVGVPFAVMLFVIIGIMVASPNSVLSEWLIDYSRRIWVIVGVGGALFYFSGIVIWGVSAYSGEYFGRWLAFNLVAIVLAFGTFPIVGPVLAMVHSLLLIYRGTRLRRLTGAAL